MENKTQAVALKYIKELPAPFLVAKGKHEMAKRLLKIAADNNVAIVNEPELSEALFRFDIGTFIPEEMYEIIAYMLAHILKMRK